MTPLACARGKLFRSAHGSTDLEVWLPWIWLLVIRREATGPRMVI
jgi:hypothetical protein